MRLTKLPTLAALATLVAFGPLVAPAGAQLAPVDPNAVQAKVGAQIGQLVILNISQQVQIEALAAEIAKLKAASSKKPESAPPTNAPSVPLPPPRPAK